MGDERRRVRLVGLLPEIVWSGHRQIAAAAEERGIDLRGEMVVFATRAQAREVVGALGRYPAGAESGAALVLDCAGAEVISPPFVDELLELRPDLQPVNLNEEAAMSWEIAAEHRAQRAERRSNT